MKRSRFESWEQDWFGWWWEMGERYAACPSILEFVDPNWDENLRQYTIQYLLGLELDVVTSRIAYPCVFYGLNCEPYALERLEGDLHGVFDDRWEFAPDLVHYVKHHNVRLPDRMLHDILTRKPEDNKKDTYGVTVDPARHATILLEGSHARFYIDYVKYPPLVEILARADAAFQNRSYTEVVDLLSPLTDTIGAVHALKLKYATKKIQG